MKIKYFVAILVISGVSPINSMEKPTKSPSESKVHKPTLITSLFKSDLQLQQEAYERELGISCKDKAEYNLWLNIKNSTSSSCKLIIQDKFNSIKKTIDPNHDLSQKVKLTKVSDTIAAFKVRLTYTNEQTKYKENPLHVTVFRNGQPCVGSYLLVNVFDDQDLYHKQAYFDEQNDNYVISVNLLEDVTSRNKNLGLTTLKVSPARQTELNHLLPETKKTSFLQRVISGSNLKKN